MLTHPGGETSPCLFCRIIAGHDPGQVVLDENDVLAFLDVRPVFLGHTLVVPRQHFETLTDLPPELLVPLFGAVRRVAAAVEAALAADGSFVAMNNRVSQSVPHLHVHVVPRRRKDGLRGFMWPRQRYADDVAMAATAATIRSALQALQLIDEGQQIGDGGSQDGQAGQVDGPHQQRGGAGHQ